MFCKNCGKILGTDDKFCAECGTKVVVEKKKPVELEPMFFVERREEPAVEKKAKRVVHLDEFNWDLDGYPTAPRKTEAVDFDWASVLEEKVKKAAPKPVEPKEKPEHMTHLNAQVLVPKTHPRIFFRCAMDTLEAELLLAQLPEKAPVGQLQEALELARKILRWDVLEEKAEEVLLDGMDEKTLRSHSHRPQDYYGKAHFMPGREDGEVVLRLNRCRCAARQAELAACRCFTDPDGRVIRPDLLQSLNRLSSFLYILMIRARPG